MTQPQDINFDIKERQSHPFKFMDIDEVVKTDVSLRNYVHAYGCSVDKKFVTRKVDGVLFVKRVK
ncbi:conserved hypothetical protein [Vibrio phage 455E52-1]|nr:conserved hypothetical protein [Vibrio phage 455E52-1]